MQNIIYPLKTISISQKYHDAHKAWDMNGEDSGIDYWYAPCRVKVSAMFPYETTGFYNTVIFTSCDENGNPSPVLLADGSVDIVSFNCTHMDSLNKFGLAVGKIYESGERCYCEGNTGLGSTGNHVHMGMARGEKKSIVKYPDGKWYMPDTINPDGLFFKLEGFNVEGNRGANGYEFKTALSRDAEDLNKVGFGFTDNYINNVDCYFFKLDKGLHDLYLEMAEPEYTKKRLTEVIPEGIVLPTNYTEMRKVPSWIGVKDKGTGKPIFAMPFNFFGDNGQIYGRCQGINVDKRPDQEEYLDAVVTNDYHIEQGNDMGQFASWEYMDLNGIKIGVSPALMLYRNGVARKLYSSGTGWSKYNTTTGLTVLAEDDESIILGVCNDGVKPQEVADWLFARGCTKVNFGDGGGSAYCAILSDSTSVPPEDEEEPIQEETQPEEVETKLEEMPKDESKEDTLIDLIIRFLKAILKYLFNEEE